MYSEIDDIRAMFEQNDIDIKVVISDRDIQKIGEDVAGRINDTLRRKYTVPFSPAPQSIKTISDHLITAAAMNKIRQGANSALIKPEVMEWYQKEGDRLLEDLRTGKTETDGVKRVTAASTTS